MNKYIESLLAECVDISILELCETLYNEGYVKGLKDGFNLGKDNYNDE